MRGVPEGLRHHPKIKQISGTFDPFRANCSPVFGDKLYLKVQMVCSQNGTAALRGSNF